MSTQSRRVPMSVLTEGGFHDWLRIKLRRSPSPSLSIGDDCAALPGGGQRIVLATADSLTEGTHFPSDAPAVLVGRFCAAINLSDIAAKGGEPAGLLCSLLIPRNTPASWPKGVVTGIEREAGDFGIHLIGGDTKVSRERAVSGMAIGYGHRRKLMPRNGARKGDLICVTGTVGRGGGSYLQWKHVAKGRREALRRMLSVTPRIREGQVLRDFANAATDTSDGLAKAVRLIGEASGLFAHLRCDEIPFAPSVEVMAATLRMQREDVAFIGGDYELVAAIPPKLKRDASAAVEGVGGSLKFIGEFRNVGGHTMRRLGRDMPLPNMGWDSFARER